jgi:hypothetical protein
VTRTFRKLALAVAAVAVPAVLAAACGRQIGDDCGVNSDCGTNWICDSSQPGGYCTISPCGPETCPSEAQCVAFAPKVSYCMRNCDAKNPCRSHYSCVADYVDYLGVSYPGFCDQASP